MCDVAFLSLAPWRFGNLVSVRAAGDDICDGLAETFSDVAQTFRASAIFHDIVEKRGNGFHGCKITGTHEIVCSRE
jgi:hypothetical protein